MHQRALARTRFSLGRPSSWSLMLAAWLSKVSLLPDFFRGMESEVLKVDLDICLASQDTFQKRVILIWELHQDHLSHCRRLPPIHPITRHIPFWAKIWRHPTPWSGIRRAHGLWRGTYGSSALCRGSCPFACPRSRPINYHKLATTFHLQTSIYRPRLISSPHCSVYNADPRSLPRRSRFESFSTHGLVVQPHLPTLRCRCARR